MVLPLDLAKLIISYSKLLNKLVLDLITIYDHGNEPLHQ